MFYKFIYVYIYVLYILIIYINFICLVSEIIFGILLIRIHMLSVALRSYIFTLVDSES